VGLISGIEKKTIYGYAAAGKIPHVLIYRPSVFGRMKSVSGFSARAIGRRG